MINIDEIIEQIGNRRGLWCPGGGDATELAAAAEYVMEQNVPLMSVAPDAVATVWPWLEKSPTKILARFYMDSDSAPWDVRASDLAVRVKDAFRHGASGAQVFIRFADLDKFVNEISAVSDDLFFNKLFSVGLDITEIDFVDWEHIFDALNKINAGALTLVMPHDTGVRSDFVGRVFGMLDAWDGRFAGGLHFALGQNFTRMEQALRLAVDVRPNLVDQMRFFISVG